MIQQKCRSFHTCQCMDDPRTIQKHVFIELTNICNFNCDFCMYKNSTRKFEIMDYEFFKSIMIQLKNVAPIDYVFFNPMGDPLMHPYIMEACEFVKILGYNLIVTTNGGILDETYDGIKADELYISLETLTIDAFSTRRDIYHQTVDTYINRVTDYCVRNRNKNIGLYILEENTILFPNYKGFINRKTRPDEAIQLLEMVGRKINPGFKVQLDADGKIPNHIWINEKCCFSFRYFIPYEMYSGLEYLPKHIEITPVEYVKNCCYYKHQIVVSVSGEVSYCCLDGDFRLSIGNLKNDSLKTIYNRRIPDQPLTHEMCRYCMGDSYFKRAY